MSYRSVQGWLPRSLRDYLLHFEASIERAVQQFAQELPTGTRVLDAGAGEGAYKNRFTAHRYIGVDLGIGDTQWNYSDLDAIADLTAIPFRTDVFGAALNVVTLEHVREPACVLRELARVLAPGGRLLLIVPHEWEQHQTPHDYFRYTRYGVRYLLEAAGLTNIQIEPVGGYFRLMSRRLLNGLQFFPGISMWLAALFLGPPALMMPLFDGLDHDRNFTLGFICTAQKPS